MIPTLPGVLLLLAACWQDPAPSPTIEETPIAPADRARLVVEVEEDRAGPGRPMPLPVRVVVTASDGTHPDGSGRGVYADGRFFAEGRFAVDLPPGPTRVRLGSGPDFEPLELTVEAKAGRQSRVRARLHRWFSPEERGWYAGDHHVHAQHDATVAIRTDLEYTALQARAGGLSTITEADGGPDPADLGRLSTPTFLLHRAPELRPGPFVGHLNTPGLPRPIEDEVYARRIDGPLPARGIAEEVHRRGGAVIHTHPLTPPHQLHWMGATEILSDAVMGRHADALDLDGQAAELLWFAVLNLGNHVAASGSTDCALGRKQTPSPGDRRVYGRAEGLSVPAMAASIRAGRTFATNGGPVFPFLTIDGKGPGETLASGAGRPLAVRAEIHALYPLKSAVLYRRGETARDFDVAGKRGEVVLEEPLPAGPDERSWYSLRVEDERGHWAITSPVYREPSGPLPRPRASALVLEISNATRFVELRREFFAHLIVTVSPGDPLEAVELIKDGRVVRRFTPDEGDRRASGKVPVTGLGGEYGPGWSWLSEAGGPVHLQADWPVTEPGWYGLRATTASGRAISCEEVHFEADHPASRALTVARLDGPETRWEHRGYGEEMPLEEIRLPFEGDHWWYPHKTYWRVRAEFGREAREVESGREGGAHRRFRPPGG